MADFAAFGHLSSDLRLQEWKFESPQIAFFSQECQYRQESAFFVKNRHFSSCFEPTCQKSSCKKINSSQMGRIGSEKGAEKGD